MENPTTIQAAELPQEQKVAENSPYAMFGTDKNLEKMGIVLDYESFEIKIARAGGSNTNYTKVLDAISKPHRRAITNETIKPETVKKIFREVYAKTVVLGWANVVDEKGIPIPFNVPNCIRLFEELDDLFLDVQEQAQKAALFKADAVEGDLGN